MVFALFEKKIILRYNLMAGHKWFWPAVEIAIYLLFVDLCNIFLGETPKEYISLICLNVLETTKLVT